MAPTGAGKTLAGFLPSLVALSERGGGKAKKPALHTLYVSPLKALAVDIARNLDAPIEGMDLPVRVETRTGDTPSHKRARQVSRPPDILLTTPEQLSLLIAHREAADLFAGLRCVILDELHALVTRSGRPPLPGDGAAAHAEPRPRLDRPLRHGARAGRVAALSRAADGSASPSPLSRGRGEAGGGGKRLGSGRPRGGGGRARADLRMLDLGRPLPISGHTAWHSMEAIYDLIKEHRTTLVFVNTRLQAEYTFQELWRLNEDTLPIAIHHGSLDAAQRRRVEAAMASGGLRAIVCTATLDLGIDWGDVDLVVNVGAPKGASRIMQRIGRANHRMDEPSRPISSPATASRCWNVRRRWMPSRRRPRTRPTPAWAPSTCWPSTSSAWPAPTPSTERPLRRDRLGVALCRLTWERFEQVIDYVATGGYALRAYERFAKILRGRTGCGGCATPARRKTTG